MKYIPEIDPEWPAAFRDPEFWGGEGSVPPRVKRALQYWTPEQLRSAASLLMEGAPQQAAAAAAGHDAKSLCNIIYRAGGRAAFIAKYARVGS